MIQRAVLPFYPFDFYILIEKVALKTCLFPSAPFEDCEYEGVASMQYDPESCVLPIHLFVSRGGASHKRWPLLVASCMSEVATLLTTLASLLILKQHTVLL